MAANAYHILPLLFTGENASPDNPLGNQYNVPGYQLVFPTEGSGLSLSVSSFENFENKSNSSVLATLLLPPSVSDTGCNCIANWLCCDSLHEILKKNLTYVRLCSEFNSPHTSLIVFFHCSAIQDDLNNMEISLGMRNAYKVASMAGRCCNDMSGAECVAAAVSRESMCFLHHSILNSDQSDLPRSSRITSWGKAFETLGLESFTATPDYLQFFQLCAPSACTYSRIIVCITLIVLFLDLPI